MKMRTSIILMVLWAMVSASLPAAPPAYSSWEQNVRSYASWRRLSATATAATTTFSPTTKRVVVWSAGPGNCNIRVDGGAVTSTVGTPIQSGTWYSQDFQTTSFSAIRTGSTTPVLWIEAHY